MDNRAFQLNEAKMFADITEGMAIIINSQTGVYYGMNGFGTSVFDQLAKGVSVEAIHEAAKNLSGAPEASDGLIDAFVDDLLAFEILVPGGEAASVAIELDAQAAANDGFEPKCTEYKDVQDLLFADPIHEVEEDTGWQPE